VQTAARIRKFARARARQRGLQCSEALGRRRQQHSALNDRERDRRELFLSPSPSHPRGKWTHSLFFHSLLFLPLVSPSLPPLPRVDGGKKIASRNERAGGPSRPEFSVFPVPGTSRCRAQYFPRLSANPLMEPSAGLHRPASLSFVFPYHLSLVSPPFLPAKCAGADRRLLGDTSGRRDFLPHSRP